MDRALTTDSPVRLVSDVVGDFKDRRRRRRVEVPSMYTTVSIRVLSRQGGPLDGHVLDLSETGMAVELDEQVPIGAAVTVEFSIAGLGRQRSPADDWPTYAVAAEVMRIDDLEDFPGGPYRTALKFVRVPTMVQAQIARFVVMQPAKVS
jgi:c-di-GMP-binding flagellar brake protein YcgR